MRLDHETAELGLADLVGVMGGDRQARMDCRRQWRLEDDGLAGGAPAPAGVRASSNSRSVFRST
jgi:hypothetical protein